MNDETPFIEAILAAPDDEAPRLIYADWLEERGDPRGEFLRVEQALAGLPKDDPRLPEVRERLEQLRPVVGEEWVALLDRTQIEGCRRSLFEGRYRLRFDVECPMRWESLTRSEDKLVRFCDGCKKKVFYCATVEQARRHASFGHCIAVDSHTTRTEGDVEIDPTRDPEGSLMMLGMPAPPAPRFRVGQRVRITAGLLEGQVGEIKSLHLSRLRATVEFAVGTQRATQELNFEAIEPVREERVPRRRRG